MLDAIVSVLLVLMPFVEFGAAKIPAPKPTYARPAPVERAAEAPPITTPNAKPESVTVTD